ncbi:MAG: hypothetical protein KIS81_06145 [Maricaulaceae bacterium]|nr:hypothetical protein [Maricaulaceae bacterium]
MADKPNLKDLMPGERALVAAAKKGEVAVLRPRQPVRAELIVALACGEPFGGRDKPFPLAPPGLRMRGGIVRGRLDFSYRRVRLGLWIRNATIRDGVSLSQAWMRDVDFDNCRTGGIFMPGAKIDGQFSADGAEIDGGGGDALNAQRAEIGAGLFLRNATLKGRCDINAAKITGQFDAEGASFDNGPRGEHPGGDALWAQGAEIGAGLFLGNATLQGRCAINGAKIGGQFDAEGAAFDNGPRGEHPGGDALWAQGAEIGAGLFLRNATLKGRCDINAAKITGQFDAEGASFDNGPQGKHPGGDALNAQRAEIGADLFLDNAILKGRCAMIGAKIGGRLDLDGARLTCAALAGDEAAEGADTVALDLSETKIGHLILPRTAATRPRGIVDLSRAHVTSFEDFAAAWPPPLDPKTRDCATRDCIDRGKETGEAGKEDIGHLVLDGFTYDRLVHPSGSRDGGGPGVAAARRNWLLAQRREHVFTHFRPQPWRQMARALARQGYEDEARRITIERRVMQRMASETPLLRRTLSWLLHLLADYGFNPWKTILWSAGIVALWAIAYSVPVWLGDCGGPPWCASQQAWVRVQADDFVPIAARLEGEAESLLSARYPHFNPVLYSLDTFIPLLDLGTERYWRANDNYRPWAVEIGPWTLRGSWGQALHWLYLIQEIIGAILVALTITGFTGLLTREDKD